MNTEFLTVAEVAAILRVSKLTVWRYIDAGKLPAYKVGRDYRIKKSEFEQFLESKRTPKRKP
jgi:excisionase family DNA binding protein